MLFDNNNKYEKEALITALAVLALTITIMVIRDKMKKDDIKGEGEVSAETKKANKIVFTRE